MFNRRRPLTRQLLSEAAAELKLPFSELVMRICREEILGMLADSGYADYLLLWRQHMPLSGEIDLVYLVDERLIDDNYNRDDNHAIDSDYDYNYNYNYNCDDHDHSDNHDDNQDHDHSDNHDDNHDHDHSDNRDNNHDHDHSDNRDDNYAYNDNRDNDHGDAYNYKYNYNYNHTGQPGSPMTREIAEEIADLFGRTTPLFSHSSSLRGEADAQGCYRIDIEADAGGVKTPFTITVRPLSGRAYPVIRKFDRVLIDEPLTIGCYPAEYGAAHEVWEIMKNLELIPDMSVYQSLFERLCDNDIDSIRVSARLSVIIGEENVSPDEYALQRFLEYGDYHVMKAKWKRFQRGQRKGKYRTAVKRTVNLFDETGRSDSGMDRNTMPVESPSAAGRNTDISGEWSDVFGRISAFIAPIWEGLCQGEYYAGDWISGAGRFLDV